MTIFVTIYLIEESPISWRIGKLEAFLVKPWINRAHYLWGSRAMVLAVKRALAGIERLVPYCTVQGTYLRFFVS